MSLTKDNKQATKRNRYSVLSSFYNFSINTALPALANPCNTAIIKKIFKRRQAIQWQIVDKETIDEIIFRTMNVRNRLMLELMARGGMRIGEVLNLTPGDIQESSLTIQNPKSGKAEEPVYVPRKILVRLSEYAKAKDISTNDRIFPISYVAAWSMVKKGGPNGRYRVEATRPQTPCSYICLKVWDPHRNSKQGDFAACRPFHDSTVPWQSE